MKKSLYLLCLLFSTSFGFAQNGFVPGPIPFNPDPLTTGTVIPLNIDDAWSAPIALPFPFCFYDSSYTSLVVGSNGIVSFDLSYANMFCEWNIMTAAPSASYPNLSIMAPYQDIDPSVGGTIKYDVRGVAPFRRFIVSYYQVPMFSCNQVTFSEQVILYETTNLIETHIADKPLCPSWNQGASIHGIQLDGVTGWFATGRNFPTAWAVSNDGYGFSSEGVCGGVYPGSQVSGRVFADYNNNCVQDPGDYPLANKAVLANGGTFYDWTDANGDYVIHMPNGSYGINEMNPAPFYTNACVPAGTYNVALSNSSVPGLDFPDSAGSICSDLTVGIGAANLIRCRESAIYVTYCNNGTHPDSNVVIVVTLNDSLTIDSASAPFTALGSNMYSFSVGSLGLGQCGNILIYTAVGCDTSGTVYCFSADISGSYAPECDTLNNHDMDCHALMAPLDPNAKYVASQNFTQNGYVQSENIGASDDLDYIIHFQNVGTVHAQDVVIRDTLSSYLDPATFRPGASSAPYNYLLLGNAILFRFENINLPDSMSNEPGSHGFVKFSIAQRPGNPIGSFIHNQASIFFDFEAPVVTNQTTNTISAVAVVKPVYGDVAQILPNPGHDQITVNLTVDRPMTFVLYDIAGEELRRVPLSGMRTAISTADLGAGVYLYRLEGEGSVLEAGKWMKQ